MNQEMKIAVTAQPLMNEFWPLEGVYFDGDGDRTITVCCSVHGDQKYKDAVVLRYLHGFAVTIKEMQADNLIYANTLEGSVSDINDCFLGFGLVFKRDFEPDGELLVEVQSNSNRQTFLIELT